MKKPLSRMTSPMALLYIYLVITQIIAGVYLTREAEPPPIYTFLYPFGLLWIVGWWLQKDSRRHGVAWVYDMGFFLFMAWPFIMPYYLFKTRGVKKALLTILIFGVVYLGAVIIGAGFYAMLMP
jgi:hypothetical protein